MLWLNSKNQIVSLYFYDNKKQATIVSPSCHLKANVNHLRSTSTYTSYFLLLFFVTKYYKSVVYVGGDSVKSDQTYIILMSSVGGKTSNRFCLILALRNIFLKIYTGFVEAPILKLKWQNAFFGLGQKNKKISLSRIFINSFFRS